MWKLFSAMRDYFRRWTVRNDGQGLQSPNVNDRLWVEPPPPPPDPSVPDPVVKFRLSRAKATSIWTTAPPPGGGSDTFVLRTTEPVMVGDPRAPSAGSNIGWNGDASGGTYSGDRTIAKGVTVKNSIFRGFVHMEGTAENCLFEGGVARTNEGGFITSTSGCTLTRCTVLPQSPSSVGYWTNAIKHTGGVLSTNRCYIAYGVDGIHSSGTTNKVQSNGDLIDFCTFVYPDNDHGPGKEYGSPTYWTHNDSVQVLSGAGPHTFIGSSFRGFTIANGITWSGGSWGSGTASHTPGVTYGRPDIPMNPNPKTAAGFHRDTFPGYSLWSNMLMFSNSGGYDITIEDCWWDGCNYPSGLFQITTGNGHKVRFRRNKVRLNGWPSSTGKYSVGYWPSGTVLDIVNSGADASFKLDNHSSVPVGRRGEILVVGSTSVSVTV